MIMENIYLCFYEMKIKQYRAKQYMDQLDPFENILFSNFIFLNSVLFFLNQFNVYS